MKKFLLATITLLVATPVFAIDYISTRCYTRCLNHNWYSTGYNACKQGGKNNDPATAPSWTGGTTGGASSGTCRTTVADLITLLDYKLTCPDDSVGVDRSTNPPTCIAPPAECTNGATSCSQCASDETWMKTAVGSACCPTGTQPAPFGLGNYGTGGDCGCPDLPPSQQTGVCADAPQPQGDCQSESNACVAACGGASGTGSFSCTKDVGGGISSACVCSGNNNNDPDRCPAGQSWGELNGKVGCYGAGEADPNADGQCDNGFYGTVNGIPGCYGSADAPPESTGNDSKNAPNGGCQSGQFYGQINGSWGCYGFTDGGGNNNTNDAPLKQNGGCPSGTIHTYLPGVGYACYSANGNHTPAPGPSGSGVGTDGNGTGDGNTINSSDSNSCPDGRVPITVDGVSGCTDSTADLRGVEQRLDKTNTTLTNIEADTKDIAAGLGTANTTLTSINDALTKKLPATAAPGSFAASITASEAQSETYKNDIKAQIATIKTEMLALFSTPALSGVGSLPCFPSVSVLGQQIELCFSDYNDKLRIIGDFLYGFAFVLAAFVIFRRV